MRTSTKLLGAGVLLASLATPLVASADSDDNALAFVIGAAVGHAIGDHDVHVRHVHNRGHGRDFARFRWHQRHKTFHRNLQRKHGRFHRFERFDHKRGHRRDDRRERRHDRHDRRDHRKGHRDRRWHG